MSKHALKLKQKEVAEILEKINKATSIVIVDYRGISVVDDTELRASLRKEGVEYKVIKNRLFARALAEAKISGLEACCEGPSAFAFSYEDPVAAASILAKKVSERKLKFKGGVVEGKVMDAQGITVVAAIPPKPVLVAQLLCMIQAPLRKLAIAVDQIAQKQA